jgi:hypothetical protein
MLGANDIILAGGDADVSASLLLVDDFLSHDTHIIIKVNITDDISVLPSGAPLLGAKRFLIR